MRKSRSHVVSFVVCSCLSVFLMANKGCIKIEPDINKNKDPEKQTPETHTWADWKKSGTAVLTGQFLQAKSPSVVKDGDVYRMFYSCFDPNRKIPGAEICQATSSDRLNWESAPSIDPQLNGRVLNTGLGVWDSAHEFPFTVKTASSFLMYFLGYLDQGGLSKSSPISVGLAESTDGVHFSQQADPVLTGTQDSYDSEMISSPSVVTVSDKQSILFYVGHCLTACRAKYEPRVLAATSSDLKNWTKLNRPVVDLKSTTWKDHSVLNAKVTYAMDGFFYLFLTLQKTGSPSVITLARSKSVIGPWLVNDKAILQASEAGNFDESGVFAPSVLIEGAKVFLWFQGNNQKGESSIGLAESSMPLYQ